jgi:NADH:ubiquinone oxidoreductase subunit 5 (subunit L)/multisubunit Na+/H+ antiporter MnhA subunit
MPRTTSRRPRHETPRRKVKRSRRSACAALRRRRHGLQSGPCSRNALTVELATEWIFIIISLVVAGIGMLLGGLFYVWRPQLPTSGRNDCARSTSRVTTNTGLTSSTAGPSRAARWTRRARFTRFDSKVVDGIVNGLAWLSRQFSRVVGGIDKYFVDGLVNTIAAFIMRLMSPLFRAAQTGFTQNYALVMVLGLMPPWRSSLRATLQRHFRK